MVGRDKYNLEFIDGHLSLVCHDLDFKPLSINFLTGKTRHRRQYGGGRGQLIAKAIGIKKLENPTVLDLTAGMGQDAFVLACLGCKVTMVERSEPIAALLEDALKRLHADNSSELLSLKLIQADAKHYLQKLTTFPDVIYLDPMYPDSKNTAAAKKEMRILRDIVGDDVDAAAVCELALEKTQNRVVVKRPRLGERLIAREPDIVFSGKSSRFDVYLSNLIGFNHNFKSV